MRSAALQKTALQTAEYANATEGNTLYIHFILRYFSRTCPLTLITLNRGAPHPRKVFHGCRKLCRSAHRGTYVALNQEKGEGDRGMERKTNGVVHRWRSKGGENKPSVILNAAEQFHLPHCLQSIILSPAQMNTQSIFSISIFRVFKVTSASIFKVFKIPDQYSFSTRRAFCFT